MTATLTRNQAIRQLTAPGEPYELRELELYGERFRVFANAPPTLRELFAETATDLPFIVYEGERLTFAEAWRKAGQVGRLLATDYGIQPGDRVAISMRNFPEWVITFNAITSIGAIAVAMNALWTPEEMAYALSDCGARVLFADQERLDRLAQLESPVTASIIAVRPTGTPGDIPELEQLLASAPDARLPEVAIEPDDPAIMFFTSGSTGHPKGVVSSHRNVLSALFSWELDGQAATLVSGVTPEPLPYQHATLLAVPLFHVTGCHAVFLQSYRAQRKLVSMYKWDPELAAELIERESITTFVAPAAMTGDLVRIAGETRRNLGSLVMVGGGGAPRAPEQVRQIGVSFGRALPNTGWGMTETNAIGAGIAGVDYLEHPASSGRAAACLDLRVVDDDGRTLPPGSRGELQIRGISVFRGYWNRPQANAESFVDGWFRTGDVAYLDDEGYLYIVDRIKDLIIRGGENIGCGQVEAALVMHPDVFEAAVYAVPDERLGEEVGATLYARPGLDLKALEAFLGDHLARFEIPRYFRLAREPLPRTASGKILKRELRAEALVELGMAS